MPTAAATLLSLLAALFLTSCATRNNLYNQPLRVKGGETPTAGYHAMRRLDQAAPSLAPFLKKQGDPEYLYIISDDQKIYLFLYYVAKNQAYAVRGPSKGDGPIELSGPQKIDPKERAFYKALIDLEPES